MEFEAIVLSFYLLFPTFLPYTQDSLARAAGKEPVTYTQREALCHDMLLVLNAIPLFEENAEESWVFDEEGLVLSGDLENPRIGPQSEGSALAEGEASVAEILYRNSLNRLQRFVYGEEQFSIGDISSRAALGAGEKSLVSANKNAIFKTELDNRYRVIERTVWQNAMSLDGISLLSKKSYTYNKENASTTPTLITEESFVNNTRTETTMGENGLPAAVRSYRKNQAGDTYMPERDVRYTYNSDGNVTMERQTVWNTDGSEEKSTRRVYTYTDVSEIPNTAYYEDDTLRITVEYESDTVYTQTVYFDGGIFVITKFDDGKKVYEEIGREAHGG